VVLILRINYSHLKNKKNDLYADVAILECIIKLDEIEHWGKKHRLGTQLELTGGAKSVF
jgi:hypothetical protein